MKPIVWISALHPPIGRWTTIFQVGALLSIFTAAVYVPAVAQQSQAKPLTTINEWKDIGTVHDSSSIAISIDESLEAHLGPKAFDDGLYIKTLATGEDRLVVKDADGFKEFDSIVFSPDGSHVLFHACPPMGADCGASRIYSVRTDGADLTMVAETNYDISSNTEYRVESSLYSPDGRKILVGIEAVSYTKAVDEQGNRVPPIWTSYAGMVAADGTEKIPERLVEGKPLFWSTDGKSFYYDGLNGLAKFDIQARISTTLVNRHTGTVPGTFEILGKVPGIDAAFELNEQDESIAITSLYGADVSRNLQDLAVRISAKDSEGRRVDSIEGLSKNRLLVRYDSMDVGDIPRYHTELIDFE